MPDDEDKDQLARPRWSVERRLEFIDFRLYWDGHVNRGDLVAHFGVSVPQASGDLSRYQEAAPQNVVYDKSAKTYVSTPQFQPAFIQPSADAYLAELRLLSSGILSPELASVLKPPEFSVMPILRRRLDPEILRRVMQAIRGQLALEVRYQSIARTEPIWRWLAPHALGFDGLRWHIRAWCHNHFDFRDFVIARILEVRGTMPSEADPSTDQGWHRPVTLKIGPHPRLTGGAREAIELDYGMENGVVAITTRACLSSYFERSLGLDLDPAQVPPDRQQVVLLNREEVETARAGTTC
jgi:predicted DNA-binding transcriptional regulator YafY